MNKTLPFCYITSALLAMSVSAQTTFAPSVAGGDIYDVSNWTNGFPSAGNPGTITVDGSGSKNQGFQWMVGAEVVVSGGATLNLGEDLGARGGILTVNDASINAGDDIFSGNNGTLIFNANSSVTSVDDFQAQSGNAAAPSSIIINGGIHFAGDDFGSQTGDNYLDMTGGQITAGDFKFDGTGNVIGGTAVLLSSSEATTLTMLGTTNILSDWSGSWTVGSFDGSDWRDELMGTGWTYDNAVIDATLFDATFRVTNGGQTLSPIPEPSNFSAFLGLASLVYFVLRKREMATSRKS